jgi:hypothetical protein
MFITGRAPPALAWPVLPTCGTDPKPDIQAAESVEPVTGIEPAQSAWEAETLPLSYTGERGRCYRAGAPFCRATQSPTASASTGIGNDPLSSTAT